MYCVQPDISTLQVSIENIRKAIAILTQMSGRETNAEVLEEFHKNGIQEPEASTIHLFLPVAGCRRLLPNMAWADDYQIQYRSDAKTVSKKWSKTPAYCAVLQEVDRFFATRPGNEKVLKIASRSAEFRAINDLLLRGSKLEDLKLTPQVVVW